MPPLRVMNFLVLALCAALAPAPAAPGQQAEAPEAERALAEVYGEARYQTEFPAGPSLGRGADRGSGGTRRDSGDSGSGRETGDGADPPDWLEGRGERPEGPLVIDPEGEVDELAWEPPSSSDSLEAAAPVFSILMWTVVIVTVLVVVLWLVQRLAGHRTEVPLEKKAQARAPAAAGPALTVDRTPLDAARALAAEGRYAEAIHELLLQTFAGFQRRSELRAVPSQTSRELLQALPIEGARREALEGLVRSVELSLFGTRVPGREEFEACERHFGELLEVWQGTAA